jgi:hypothetical protein
MGCCGGGHNQNEKRVKDWNNEGQVDQPNGNISPLLILIGILAIGLVVYKFII